MAQKYKSKWTGPQVDEAIGNVSKKIDKDSLIGSDGITINKTDSTIEISGTELVKKTTEANKVYGTDSTGEQALKPLVNTPTPFALAVYNDVSNLKTSVPVEDLDCTNRKYADDNYVKKSTSTTAVTIYARENGIEINTQMNYSNSASNQAVPRRDVAGSLYIPDTSIGRTDYNFTAGQEAINKKYVDDNFINKLSPTPNYFSAVIYSPIQKIYTGYKMEIAPQQLTIPYRDTKGNFKVGDITADDDGQYCANKKYVDDANKDLYLKFTNLEQALNGYILDTTKEAYADLETAVLKDSVAVGDNVYPIADKTRALVTRIEGKTTKMVQLLDKSTFPATQTVNGVTFTNNGDGSITVNGTPTDDISYSVQTIDCQNGHKYFLSGCPSGGSTNTYCLWFGNRDVGNGVFVNINDNNKRTVSIKIQKDVTASKLIYKVQLFDLTAMNREDITTVEQFKAEFPEPYPYENGNIYPVKISGVKFTGKNLFDPTTPKYSGLSSFRLDGDNIIVSQSITATYISANFELPNAKFFIGKKISISAKVKTSDNNRGIIRVLWMRGNAAVNTPGMEIISNSETGETERNLSASGIVLAPSDDALKLCLLLYSNADGNLSETKTYTATYSNIQVEISDAATAYEPYIEPVSVTLPEIYDLHGIGDYKDYLEITKNENNELYTLKKVQSVEVNESEKTITPLATPVETVIATNLTYEQVTAIRHNSGLIEVEGNVNKGYARPTVKNTIVYRLTATNVAEG